MEEKLEAALVILDRHGLVQRLEALDALCLFTTNLRDHPNDERYRSVWIENLHYKERFGKLRGSKDAMEALGFRLQGEQFEMPLEWVRQEGFATHIDNCVQMIESRQAVVRHAFSILPLRMPIDQGFQSVRGAATACAKGPVRREMEDDEILVDCFGGVKTQAYFGLYDGHGGRGTVDFIVKVLHENLALVAPGLQMKDAFQVAFTETDEQIRRQNILRSGATAVTCLLSRDANGLRHVHTANVGDSRAVLVRSRAALRLTLDHKPDLPEEQQRITAAGGQVISGRVNGVLAVSRAFGDFILKENQIVTVKPYVNETPLVANDTHLIMACDGVWDVMSDQEAVDLVLDFLDRADKEVPAKMLSGSELNHRLQEAAAALVAEALARNTTDNVTVIIVEL